MAMQATYTQEEVDFVGSNHEDLTVKEMAAYLERERQTIYNILNKHGWKAKLDPDYRKPKPRNEDSEIVNDRSLKRKRAQFGRHPGIYTNSGYANLSETVARIEHELKTWPVYFEAIVRGDKNFEARKDDRDFQKGDTLILREWDPAAGEYTGRTARRFISFVLPGGQLGVERGFCVMGLQEEGQRVAEDKAITILQPWASLVVAGAKQYLTRWTSTSYRGKILIHAAGRRETIPEGLSSLPAIIEGLGGAQNFNNLPYGAIIGEAMLIDVCRAEDVAAGEQEKVFGDFAAGRYAWKIADPVKYEEPLPCKGPAALWEYQNQTI